VQIVTLRDQKIFPAIIAIIQKADAPAGVERRHGAYPVHERSITRLEWQGLIGDDRFASVQLAPGSLELSSSWQFVRLKHRCRQSAGYTQFRTQYSSILPAKIVVCCQPVHWNPAMGRLED
jgi:hypothetical protein